MYTFIPQSSIKLVINNNDNVTNYQEKKEKLPTEDQFAKLETAVIVWAFSSLSFLLMAATIGKFLWIYN